jgi:hypothetical protein
MVYLQGLDFQNPVISAAETDGWQMATHKRELLDLLLQNVFI